MKDYNNLVEALADLKNRGYTNDFNLKSNCIHCAALELEIHPEDFEVTEVYRFEGESNPSDSSVLYAIQSKDDLKGVLIDAYGVYADSLSLELATKLGSTRV